MYEGVDSSATAMMMVWWQREREREREREEKEFRRGGVFEDRDRDWFGGREGYEDEGRGRER